MPLAESCLWCHVHSASMKQMTPISMCSKCNGSLCTDQHFFFIFTIQGQTHKPKFCHKWEGKHYLKCCTLEFMYIILIYCKNLCIFLIIRICIKIVVNDTMEFYNVLSCKYLSTSEFQQEKLDTPPVKIQPSAPYHKRCCKSPILM